MNDFTLYDLMGQDTSIFAKVHNGHVEVEVMDERDVTVYKEISHPYAWETLVSFAKQVIKLNERIEKQLEEDL